MHFYRFADDCQHFAHRVPLPLDTSLRSQRRNVGVCLPLLVHVRAHI